jgi:hypothetical protein
MWLTSFKLPAVGGGGGSLLLGGGSAELATVPPQPVITLAKANTRQHINLHMMNSLMNSSIQLVVCRL